MFCPQPLLQLPKLPSHVVPECAACLEKQSGQTAPLLNILVAGRSWNRGFRPRLPFKSCGSCVVQRGSNNAKTLAHACFAKAKRKETMWFPCGSTRFQQ